ncbi:MAG: carbohydrate ABC transporter permease [Planctomycetes bacterium]|nr:carbohydrate ABC transporter permease [Planctomycetota bacterium]
MRVSSTASVLRYAALIAVALLLAAPLLAAFTIALSPIEEVYSTTRPTFPTSLHWSNFFDAIEKVPFLRFIANSMLIVMFAVPGAILTSAMAGYAFARLQWKGKKACVLFLFCSLVVPAQVLLIPHFVLFSWLGWVNTYKPLIVPAWLGGGAFNVFLFWQFFRTIPRDYDDAARLDGASHWFILTRVMLPIAKPAVAATCLLSFVYHWQEFQKPLIYLSDFRTYPVALGLRMYQATGGSWINLVMAASLLALVPILVVFLCLQRHIDTAKRESKT